MKKVDFVRIKAEICGYCFGKGMKYSFELYIPIGTMSLIFQKEE